MMEIAIGNPKIRFIKVEDEARKNAAYIDPILPTYATTEASGFDLYTIQDVLLQPGMPMLIPTGWKVEFDEPNSEIQIRPRSGNALNDGITILNSPGTIDKDYKGEICVIALWTGANTSLNRFEIIKKNTFSSDGLRVTGSENLLKIPAGTKIAQGVLCPIYRAKIVEADEFENEESERGESGFGSTGV